MSPESSNQALNTALAEQLKGKKVAFISVFDKTGLEHLAQAMVTQYGYTLLATGGTKKYLDEKGIPSEETSDITGFTELLGGRVKSLHPTLFAGILADNRNPDDPDLKLVPFYIETVIVNLYPFEAERDKMIKNNEAVSPEHLLHFIDIGGSALLRAGAKNHPCTNVLCKPEQYDGFLQELKMNSGRTSLGFRQKLAFEAFQRSVAYDSAITSHLQTEQKTQQPLAPSVVLPLQKIEDLRYGENPHQQAALYGLHRNTPDFELLHGKALSYNNILDMQAGWNIVLEFEELPAAAVIKHNNPSGVAVSRQSIEVAYHTAFEADPLSAFGGVVAINRPVTASMAKQMKDVFLEVIIAPGFEPEAFELLSSKKNLRLVQRAIPKHTNALSCQLKQVSPELFLMQTDPVIDRIDLQYVTEQKPSTDQLEDMAFAWKVVKHVKSNAIVVAKHGRTVGIGGGQVSRIAAMENALRQACDEAKDAVVASDGFFPQTDNIEAAAQARVGAIIQPGGSIKDAEVIAAANRLGIPMAVTGTREFKH